MDGTRRPAIACLARTAVARRPGLGLPPELPRRIAPAGRITCGAASSPPRHAAARRARAAHPAEADVAHAWGAGGPGWRSSGGDDDNAVFARWAEDPAAQWRNWAALDDAQLPDWLVSCAPEFLRGAMPAWRWPASSSLPQQERLPPPSPPGMRIAPVGVAPRGRGRHCTCHAADRHHAAR
jgi:hypothetical protein